MENKLHVSYNSVIRSDRILPVQSEVALKKKVDNFLSNWYTKILKVLRKS